MRKPRITLTSIRRRWSRLTAASRILYVGSAAALLATVLLVVREGGQVYYLTFHRPFSLAFQATPAAAEPTQKPVFQVVTTLSATRLHAGDKLHIDTTYTSNQDATGFYEIWLRSPDNVEVFKSPADEDDMDPQHPQQFEAGKPQTHTFDYAFPTDATPGIYTVSEIITSPNQQTDYYVHEKFATVTIL